MMFTDLSNNVPFEIQTFIAEGNFWEEGGRGCQFSVSPVSFENFVYPSRP